MEKLEKHRQQYNRIKSIFNKYRNGMEDHGYDYVEDFYVDKFLEWAQEEDSHYHLDQDPNDYNPGDVAFNFQPYFNCVQNIKSAIEKLFESPSFEDHHQLDRIYSVISNQSVGSVDAVVEIVLERFNSEKDYFDTSLGNEWKEECSESIYSILADIEEYIEEDKNKIDERCNWTLENEFGSCWENTGLELYSLNLFPIESNSHHAELIFERVEFLKWIKEKVQDIQYIINYQLDKLKNQASIPTGEKAFQVDCLRNENGDFGIFLNYLNDSINADIIAVSQKENKLTAKFYGGGIGSIGKSSILTMRNEPVRNREQEEIKLMYYRKLISKLKSV